MHTNSMDKLQTLCDRQLALLSRISDLEKRAGTSQAPADVCPADASPVQKRLTAELVEKGFTQFKFVRVPADYYDRPLEYRQECLAAHSIEHLCKSIIMENTKAHPSVDGWADPLNSKYYVVIVQYTARLQSDNLAKFIHKLNDGKVGRQYFNMRLAPEDVSDELSGFTHNAVTPVGIRTQLPIIISDKITQLQPEFFWLGGGEVDLKLGLKVSEFLREYKPFVASCTY